MHKYRQYKAFTEVVKGVIYAKTNFPFENVTGKATPVNVQEAIQHTGFSRTVKLVQKNILQFLRGMIFGEAQIVGRIKNISFF